MNSLPHKKSQPVRIRQMGGGGDLSKSILRKLHFKSFFSLIKAYKRYYFGVWIIKLPFYQLISNKNKTQKWKQKRKERYGTLQSALKIYFEIVPQMKNWIHSKDFKEKYLDTHYLYPPLLNPDSINYEFIPAKLAWEMNLPLPPNYEFIYMVVWGCASNSMRTYCECSSLKLSPLSTECTDFMAYKLAFDFLNNQNNDKKVLLIHHNLDGFVGEKFLSLVTKKCPIFIVVRDPLSVIKTWVNHTIPNPNKIKEFNLTFDYKRVLDCITYEFDKLPNMEAEKAHWANKNFSFVQAKYLDFFMENEKIIVDVKDLSEQKVFQTIQQLSIKLNFVPSKKAEDYIDKKNTPTFHYLFPLTLILHKTDLAKMFSEKLEQQDIKSLKYKESIKIIIIDGLKGWFLCNTHEQLEGIKSRKVLFFITKSDAQKLYNDKALFEATKKYLQGFLVALDERITLEEKKQLNEKDVLEYFAKNKDRRKEYKAIFDENLTFVKQLRPDIIKSWKYYLEFEKMCVELDG